MKSNPTHKVKRNANRRLAGARGSADSWQPIETAPKDGSLILLWRCDEVEMAKWMAGPINEWWHNKNSEPLSRFDKYDSGVPDEWEMPTHWMPLPHPPNDQAQPHLTARKDTE